MPSYSSRIPILKPRKIVLNNMFKISTECTYHPFEFPRSSFYIYFFDSTDCFVFDSTDCPRINWGDLRIVLSSFLRIVSSALTASSLQKRVDVFFPVKTIVGFQIGVYNFNWEIATDTQGKGDLIIFGMGAIGWWLRRCLSSIYFLSSFVTHQIINHTHPTHPLILIHQNI